METPAERSPHRAWVICEHSILEMLFRVHRGDDPNMVMLEMLANTEAPK